MIFTHLIIAVNNYNSSIHCRSYLVKLMLIWISFIINDIHATEKHSIHHVSFVDRDYYSVAIFLLYFNCNVLIYWDRFQVLVSFLIFSLQLQTYVSTHRDSSVQSDTTISIHLLYSKRLQKLTDVSLLLASILPVRNWENLSIQMTEINLAVIKVILLRLHSSVYFITWWNYIYISVNFSNQTDYKLFANFRQFVKYLFQSVNLQIVWKL